mgnify:CR=1 FL=1|tara:strand:+ start:353 stop:577 length:225 start_codon:yes stop_codon:yes gene_type:complete
MPYQIKKYKSGFRVCKTNPSSECFSNKPLTKKMAKKQRTAIILSELGLSKPQKGKGFSYITTASLNLPVNYSKY